tara:strand:+ start:1089 stop:1406 length:318 start_codon:yes stop_codon:yes gene_type:complete
MGFKRSVLITALIVFIVMLLIMAVVIKNSYENVVYPPEISLCPDYWEVNDDGKTCKATNNNRGTFAVGDVSDDFSDMSNSARIDKCIWASDNGVNWDGVTNRNLC